MHASGPGLFCYDVLSFEGGIRDLGRALAATLTVFRLYDGLMITGSSNGGWWPGEHIGACAVLPNASPCVSSHVVREHSSVCGTVGRRLLRRHTGSGRAFLRHSHIIAHIPQAFLSDVACDGSKVLSSCAPLSSHVLFVLFAYVPVVC